MKNYIEVKAINPIYRQKIAKDLGCSNSTIKRYRNDLNMDVPDKTIQKKKENPEPSIKSSTLLKGSTSTKIANSGTSEKYLDGTLEKSLIFFNKRA